jgi:putative transposase
MIDPEHAMPISHQAELLDISRSSFYYQPKPIPPADLALMLQIDQNHTEHPTWGARMHRDALRRLGVKVGRRHVASLMRLMGIEAIYCKKRTTLRNPAHPIYPYLLRDVAIQLPNHVWCADISYIPMAHGFLYLFAVLDWATRRVLSWRLSNTMTTDFCIEAVEEAIANFGTPLIFNTDQGSQFTDHEFTGLLKSHDIQISMDGKGAWRDNVFIERFWRTIKYDEVYLRAYESATEARKYIGKFIRFYNEERPHSSLDGCTPDEVYYNLPRKVAA